MSEQENLNLVQQTYMAFGRGDLPAVLNNLADTIIWKARYPSNVPFGGDWKGHEGFTQFVTIVGETLDLKEFVPAEFIAQGDTVVVLGYEVAGVKGTGSEYKNEWVHVFKIQDGKVKDFQSYNDTATVGAAFGQ